MLSDKKVVVRVKGGLGNQLFCYAAAKRLAVKNDCECVIDHVSGFARDRIYKRSYELDNFALTSRLATKSERMEPFARQRKSIAKRKSKRKDFQDRNYIIQEQTAFDKRLLSKKIVSRTYIDGHWQSEKYFNDIADSIRGEFTIGGTIPDDYRQLEAAINSNTAVNMHVRWFNDKNSDSQTSNMSTNYYRNAIKHICDSVKNPTFFLFSDDIEAAYNRYKDLDIDILPVSNYVKNSVPYLDMWAMSQCKHHIMANSTFSWWGAWLSTFDEKTVICPQIKMQGGTTHEASWNFDGLIPERWIKI